MVDADLIKRIVSYAEVNKNDAVFEIGPGTGNLTSEILKKTINVIAVEKDQKLSEKLQHRGAKIILGDALKIEFPKFSKCVSNIPYSISKKLVIKLLNHDFKVSVLTVQEEFADKLVAKPRTKNYTALSVFAQSQVSIELLEDVPKNAFKPQPKVKSAVIRLTRKRRQNPEFYDFINKLFQYKNKKLRSALKHSNFDVSKALPEFLDLKVNSLTAEQFLKLFTVYSKKTT